ncbi:MAG: hypothetical protein K2G63_04185 [Oscillospiraceae bacterium]|nr:hypothetical protein [Oscillospiraceae bacterium]
MSEIKSIKEKSNTYDSENSGGFFKTSENLRTFGENQNNYNNMLAEKIEELTKRICTLETEQQQNKELFKRLANELVSLKAEVDRLKLTSRLNTNTIDRLVKAIDISEEKSSENPEKK